MSTKARSRLKRALLPGALGLAGMAGCAACALTPMPGPGAMASGFTAASGPLAQTGGTAVLVRDRQDLEARDYQASFIVKFSGEPAVLPIARSWRRDPEGAAARFANWASAFPELDGLVLTGASYSGELILSLPANEPAGRTPQQVLAALQGMENIRYAEPDSTAYPSLGATQ